MKHYKIWLIVGSVAFVLLVVMYLFLRNKNPLDVNVKNIELEVKMERFDKIMFDQKMPIEKRIQILNEKYDVFYDVFNYDIISIGGIENRSYAVYLQTFLNDYAVQQAYHAVDSVFKDTEMLNSQLTDGFKHYKYYYADSTVPRVVGFIAGFNQSVATMDGFIGVGLDKYLGSRSNLYAMLQIPDYAAGRMTPEQIPFDVMTAFAQMQYPYSDSSETLLNRMIYNGKIQYFLDAMYPQEEDSLKHAYSSEDIDYCRWHEKDMWAFIIDKKLLFSTDYLVIRNYCDDAPYTKDFGMDSPPRAGNWLGWRIVSSYMKHNKVSLPELMAEQDYQKILNMSKYDPE